MFKIEVDGKEVELEVVLPTLKDKNASEQIRNKKFREALDGGAYLKKEIGNILKERGQFGDKEEAEVKKLKKQIEEGVKKLNEGGFDIDEAVSLAEQISKWRGELVQTMQVYADMADFTAEGQADNAAFDCLISRCVVYNKDKNPFYSGYEDYVNKKNKDYSYACANEFYKLMGGIDTDSIGDLPEFQFLKEYGFIDDKLRKINNDGKLVDDDGRLIDEEGYYLDDNGNRIDKFGNKLDENNKPIIERKPFTKGGQPIEKKVVKEKEQKVEDSVAEEVVVEQKE